MNNIQSALKIISIYKREINEQRAETVRINDVYKMLDDIQEVLQ